MYLQLAFVQNIQSVLLCRITFAINIYFGSFGLFLLPYIYACKPTFISLCSDILFNFLVLLPCATRCSTASCSKLNLLISRVL